MTSTASSHPATQQGHGADCLQRTLVPRSRFRQQLMPGVRGCAQGKNPGGRLESPHSSIMSRARCGWTRAVACGAPVWCPVREQGPGLLTGSDAARARGHAGCDPVPRPHACGCTGLGGVWPPPGVPHAQSDMPAGARATPGEAWSLSRGCPRGRASPWAHAGWPRAAGGPGLRTCHARARAGWAPRHDARHPAGHTGPVRRPCRLPGRSTSPAPGVCRVARTPVRR